MFDIGLLEFVTLGVIALLVFGPERLPKVTAQAAHWLRQLREQAQSARQTITDSVDMDSGMLKDLAELHPRNIARSVMDPVNDAAATAKAAASLDPAPTPQSFPGASSATQSGPATASGTPAAEAAPFDPDAT